MAGGIFVHQEFVGIRGELVVAAPEFVAHLRIESRHRQQRVAHFRGMRRNQVYAAITGNHLLVFGKRALLDGLAVQRCAQFFGARKLGGSSLTAVGAVVSFGMFTRMGRVGAAAGKTTCEANPGNEGSLLVEKIVACQHPRLARPAALERSRSAYSL